MGCHILNGFSLLLRNFLKAILHYDIHRTTTTLQWREENLKEFEGIITDKLNNAKKELAYIRESLSRKNNQERIWQVVVICRWKMALRLQKKSTWIRWPPGCKIYHPVGTLQSGSKTALMESAFSQASSFQKSVWELCHIHSTPSKPNWENNNLRFWTSCIAMSRPSFLRLWTGYFWGNSSGLKW